MKVNFNFRDYTELLILDNVATGVSTAIQASDLSGSTPQLTACDVWATYALVSNNERKQMGSVARDILIEQVQTVPSNNYSASSRTSVDLRLSHAIKALFFGVRNKTNTAEWSNYTAASPYPSAGSAVNFSPDLAVDPIDNMTLLYEGTQRLSNMGSDYFTLINPWYHAVSIPLETGYHMYSYALDLVSINPTGSTDYGKLTNISTQFNPSAACATAAASGGTLTAPNAGLAASGAGLTQVYETTIIALSNTIVRISGGALGFPVL
jgi:hypothetical protein